MKTNTLPTPENLTLTEIMERFSPDESDRDTNPDRKAREYLEAIRWPNGPVCPHCQNAEAKQIWKIEVNIKKKVRGGLHQCGKCKQQFTVTVGTIFEDSHIPLRKWLIVWYLVCSAKKGISALQVQRSLGFGSYRTAWMMMHKIRHALKDPVFSEKLSGTTEYDETYVGGKPRKGGKHGPTTGYRRGSNKIPVVAIVERGGAVRTKVVPRVTYKNVRSFINDTIDAKATVNTDSTPIYPALFRSFPRHDTVNHSNYEYARHNADGTVSHVNTAESFFSLLKRGVYGAFHCVSREHLHRYCDEFTFRWDHRKVTDGERLIAGLNKVGGKRLTYKPLIGA